MTRHTKITLGVVAIAAVALGILLVVSLVQALMGIDASKEDPQKLFMFYGLKPIPPDISVQSAVGHANFGGTCITFRLKISGKDLDALIASKGLQKTNSLPEHLFPDEDLAAMGQPEFYTTAEHRTGSNVRTTVTMAVDRGAGVAFYRVFSP